MPFYVCAENEKEKQFIDFLASFSEQQAIFLNIWRL